MSKMESIFEKKPEWQNRKRWFVIEFGEVIVGLIACLLISYFYLEKGYWSLIMQIWSSFFG